MYNAPYRGVANDLAKYGRYGDSMLVHMNPIEVQMLASMSPTGRLTTNPMTGQQEAFLPFLAPLLGSFLGKAALGSTLTTALGSKALGAAAAGALGSAAATTAVTGDLEQGIMSGITGFGIGSALGGLDELAKAGTGAAEAAAQGATTFSPGAAAATMNPLAADATLQAAIESAPSSFTPGVAGAQMTAAPDFADITASPAVTPTASPTFMESLAQPFQQPGEFIGQLAKPGSFLPMYVGETGRMAREQELMGQGSMAEYEKEQEAARQKTLRQMGDVFNRVRQAYPGVGYAKGGQVERYYDGGSIEEQVRQAMMDQYQASALPVAEDVQLSLRGAQFVPPPASSYSALDVGGEGYLAGVAPEFQYFREPPPPPPAAIAPPPPGSIAGGDGFGGFDGFDFSGIDLSGFRNRFFDENFTEPGPRYMPEDVYFSQPQVEDTGIGALPRSNIADIYGGIASFNLPAEYQQQVSAPVVPEVPTVGMEDRFFTPREPREDISFIPQEYRPPAITPQVPPEEPQMMGMEDEFNPFSIDFKERSLEDESMFAEGGMTERDSSNQSIVDMTIAAIRGEVENADEIISQFLDMYGPEAFAELRDRVLKDIVPGAQTEGMVQGEGGGQDDMVEGMIGTQRPVAVSPGEYIIPADVVALAGGGYSGDGAKYFDGLIEDIRMKTMGKTDQVKPYQQGV